MNPIDKILSRIEAKPAGNGRYKACCPAHDEKTPSLFIREQANGLILLHCFGGCEVEDIVSAMDLTMGDLFPDDIQRKTSYCKNTQARVDHEKLILSMGRARRNSGEKLNPLDINRMELAVHRLKGAGVL